MADGAQMQPLPGLSRAPRSIDFDSFERDLAVAEICGRLAKGEPLSRICRESYMPAMSQVYVWADADSDLAGKITLARDAGFDAIALDAMRIIDGSEPARDENGKALQPDANRDKARADVRLRLLAKWDPKRYGEAVQMRMADANGEKLDTTPLVRELLALVRPADGSQAAPIEGSARVIAPGKEKPSAG